MAAASAGSTIIVGSRKLIAGKTIIDMTDSTNLYHSTTASRQTLLDRLETDGYILIRGALPSPVLASARSAMLAHIAELGGIRSGEPAGSAKIERQSAWDAKNSKRASKKSKSTASGQYGGKEARSHRDDIDEKRPHAYVRLDPD